MSITSPNISFNSFSFKCRFSRGISKDYYRNEEWRYNECVWLSTSLLGRNSFALDLVFKEIVVLLLA